MADRSFIYENIAERIGNLIIDGVLKPGDRAPSLRDLSKKLEVSITSVMKAYTVLEGQGLIEAQPQSGFYVRTRLRRLPPQPAVPRTNLAEVKVAKNQLIASYLETIKDPRHKKFGCASPDLSFLPLAALQKLTVSVSKNGGAEVFDYSFPPGSDALRREISKRSLGFHCHVAPQDTVVTSGGLDALNLCLNVVAQPGDAIAIESPTYFGVLQAIEKRGLRAVEIPAHPQDGVDLDILESVLEQKAVKACLFVPNFNNPLGSLMPDANKQRLAEMVNRFRIPLIEDDIYGDLHFGSQRPKPVKAFDQGEWVLLCSSFSKTLAPGLRVGFAASSRFVNEIKATQFMTTLAAPSLSQAVVASFLSRGLYDRHMRALRKACQTGICRISDALSDAFPQGTRVTKPQGGFVIWVALPPGLDSVNLYKKAMENHISFAPGPLFTARKSFRNYLRINCAHPWSEDVIAAIDTLGVLAHRMVA